MMIMTSLPFVVVFLLLCFSVLLPSSSSVVVVAAAAVPDVNEIGQESYDIDSSWAIHSETLKDTFGKGIKQRLYDKFMDGCRAAVGNANDTASCNDEARINMNTYQPLGMRNYTRLGFQKIRAPDKVFALIQDFWKANEDKQEIEWKENNVYHNMWEAPTKIVNVQNSSLDGGGYRLRNDIWEAAREVLEEWTGQYLAHCSLWGIRVYGEQSILAPHVDRNPLISSAIINVAQDVDEPWPLEVWGHDGKPYNITMEPGDMVLYESHSVIHGRPFPLKGTYYANIFVHYEVLGSKDPATGEYYLDEDGLASRQAGLPPYIVAGSEWAEDWHEKNPNGWELFTPIDARKAAEDGDLNSLKIQAVVNKSELYEGDENDWRPIHLAARAGHVHVMDFLLTNGADVDTISNHGRGWSPLQIAMDYLGESHEMCSLLKDAGGHAINMQKDEL